MNNITLIVFYISIFLLGNISNYLSAETIKFATSLPLTGVNRSVGYSIRIGIESAFDEVNKNGGINNKLLELIVENDDFEYTNTKKNVQTFASNPEIMAILNVAGSANNQAILNIIQQDKILLYSPFTGNHEISKNFSRYIINYRPDYSHEIIEIFDMLDKVNIKLSEILVFQEFNKNINIEREYIKNKVKNKYKNISSEEIEKIRYITYIRNTAFSDNEYNSIIKKNQHNNIKAFILSGDSINLAKFIKDMKQFYPDAYYFILSTISPEILSSTLCINNTILCSQYTRLVILTQIVPSFRSKNIVIGTEYQNAIDNYLKTVLSKDKPLYSEYRNIGYNSISFESYITTRILIEGLKKLQKEKHEISRENLINALDGIENLDIGLGEVISLSSDNHQISTKIWQVILKRKVIQNLTDGLLEIDTDFKNSWKDYLP